MPPPTVMAGLRPTASASAWKLVCAECRRSLSSSAAVASGHNRWSKIKHEKGAADLKKTALRSSLTKTMAFLSSMYGPDINTNPQLATTVTNAKKNGVPKAIIEAAIARGQGRSAAGVKLDQATFEIVMPPSIALVIDAETDSKARVQQELNAMTRRKGGQVKSTKFFFSRRGRVVFAAAEPADAETETEVATEVATADDILEDVIEAGAEDVETDDDGNIVVWTPPLQTTGVVNAVTNKFKSLTVLNADTIWAANEETRAPLGSNKEELRKLAELLAALSQNQDVRAVYCNAVQGEAPDDLWEQIAEDVDW